MLEWRTFDIGAPTLSFNGLAEGYRLVFNRLFSISEERQLYAYVMFDITAPEAALPGYIGIALMTLAIFFALFCVGLTYIRSNIPLVITMVIVVAMQVYFGVFPNFAPSVLLFATFALILVYRPGMDVRGGVAIIGLTAIVAAAVWLVYPGQNPQLLTFSEAIRDRLSTRVAYVYAQDAYTEMHGHTLEHRTLHVAYVQDEYLHEAQRVDYYVDHDNRALGANIGFAMPQPSLWPVILAVMALGVIAAIAKAVPPLVKGARRRRMFAMAENAAAIDYMFAYALEWLTAYGLKQRNIVYSAYSPDVAVLISPDYAAEYDSAVTIWHQAVYSNHIIDEATWQQMKAFVDKTSTYIWQNSNISARLRLKFNHCL